MKAFPRHRSVRYLGAALLVAACLGWTASAQEEAEAAPADLFAEQIGIEVVNIDVVVTDKKGRVVEGLTREDFELRIDGREVEIANFYAVTGAAGPPRTAGVAAEPAVAPAGATAAPRDPLHLVVYFDSFYLTPISRRRVLADLPGFFERQIADGARILLATRLQEVQVPVPFTTDLDELGAALAKIAEAPAVGLQQTSGHRQAMQAIQDAYELCNDNPRLDPCVDCLEHMVNQARFYSVGLLAERRGAVAALSRLVNALSVLDGRKALMHVSDGIEVQPGVDLFYYIGEQLCPHKQQLFQEYYMRRDVDDLNDLVARANASRVTFYALEAAGPRNFSAASAQYADHFFKPSSVNDQIRIANLQNTLHYMSTETGGKAILNATRFGADLDGVAGELRSYYSLGYQPEHPGRGRSHRVSVKTTKQGHVVRYRRAFLHKKPDQQLADRALGAVFFGVTENPLGATVEVQAQSPGEKGRVVVPLEVSVPLARLTLVPRQDARHGRMTVIVTAPDENNDDLSVRRKEFPVTLPLAATPDVEDVYRFGVNVELLPGSYRLGVGVWDDVAAVGSFLNVSVEVPEEAP